MYNTGRVIAQNFGAQYQRGNVYNTGRVIAQNFGAQYQRLFVQDGHRNLVPNNRGCVYKMGTEMWCPISEAVCPRWAQKCGAQYQRLCVQHRHRTLVPNIRGCVYNTGIELWCPISEAVCTTQTIYDICHCLPPVLVVVTCKL